MSKLLVKTIALTALLGVARASLLEDALLFKRCLTYGEVDTIRLAPSKPRDVKKKLILRYGGGNATQISSPFWTTTLDTLTLLIIIPSWLDSAGVKIRPSGALIESQDSLGINYGATFYCLEVPAVTRVMDRREARERLLSVKVNLLGRRERRGAGEGENQ